jgi:choline dehydrogenase-like flavoprotein
VSAVRLRSLEGNAARLQARAFVLCCGGVGNARTLLEGARTTGAAFGGAQVGRFFQQHSRGVIATLQADEAQSARLQRMLNIFRPVGGAQHEIGLALSHDAQKAERLLNASAIVVYEEDPDSGWESAKAVWRRLRAGQVHPEILKKLKNVASEADRVTENVLRRAAGRTIVRARRIAVLVDLEQAPDPESRITLSDKLDAFGAPLPKVDWRLSELERRTALRFATHIKTEVERLGLAEVALEDWLTSSAPMAETPLRETFHHIGATRMSETAAQGVVDRDCKVHGFSNLYVAGSSVFPTGGHANPTFTIVALAARLADHLRGAMQGKLAGRVVAPSGQTAPSVAA